MPQISLKLYAVKRLFQIIPLIIIVIFMNFMIMHLAPGDPVDVLIGEQFVEAGYREALRERLGLNKPLYEQLFIYLKNIFSGELGYSFVYRQPVLTIILERVPETLLLMGFSFGWASVLGIVLGVYASRKPYSKIDNVISTISLIGYSTPSFWFGLVLLLIFSLFLGWFPAQGMETLGVELTGFAAWLDILKHLILPSITLGTVYLAIYARFTRASMLEVLRKDYIITAWGKGLDERTVLYGHALKNALLPVVTLIGLNLGFMLTGAVIVETVFAWPGLGRLMYDSIFTRDYPLLMGIFLMVSIIVMLSSLVTDILYAYLDPRIRYG